MLKIIAAGYFFITFLFVSALAGTDPSNIKAFSDPTNSIPVVGNEFIMPVTNTTLQQITAVPQTLEKGQVILRRRFSANEYGLYLGVMNSKAYSKLSAFKPKENLTISSFVSKKIYSFQTDNLDQDIENVYFDGDLIYVENIATIFHKDSVWKEIRMLDVLPCRLNITSDPPGATVYVNNEYQGSTPLYMGAIYEPTAIVKIDMKGYFTTEIFIYLQNGALLEKHFELTKKDVFKDGSEIDSIPVWRPDNDSNGSVLEINQSIATFRKSADKIMIDSANEFVVFLSKYPPFRPKDQFETTEEYQVLTNEYNAKFNRELDSLKKMYSDKHSRILQSIPQMEAYREILKNREYTKYFDGNLLKLSNYNADSGFFPVNMSVDEKGFNYSFNGRLYIPRDEAKEFHSKGTSSGKILLTYKNWQITIPRQDTLQDTVKESYYVYDIALKLKFKEVNYDLKGICTYPAFITNSLEYAEFRKALNEREDEERLAREARGYLSITTDPPNANFFLNGSDKGITPYEDSLQPGTYSITLQSNGYNDIFDTITVIKDLETEKSFVLEHSTAFLDSVAIAKKEAYKTFRNVRRLVFSSLAVTIGGIGVFFEKEARNDLKYYNALDRYSSSSDFDNAWDNFRSASKNRNVCYILSGMSFFLFAVSIPL